MFVGLLVAAVRPHVPTAGQLGWGALAGAIGRFGIAAFYSGLAVGAMGIVGADHDRRRRSRSRYGLARGERPCVPAARG